jgi:hypothetical protein
MEYGVLDLGTEKLVARYVGPAEPMAFNESVMRESLLSLQGQRFGTADLPAPENVAWTTMTDASGRSVLPVPASWILEPGRPSPCRGLPEPAVVATATPAYDASIVLRAAIWPGGVAPDAAASACAPQPGPAGAASYSSRVDWLGVAYAIDGAFMQLGSGQVVQLEVLATDRRTALARGLLAIWLKKVSE